MGNVRIADTVMKTVIIKINTNNESVVELTTKKYKKSYLGQFMCEIKICALIYFSLLFRTLKKLAAKSMNRTIRDITETW